MNSIAVMKITDLISIKIFKIILIILKPQLIELIKIIKNNYNIILITQNTMIKINYHMGIKIERKFWSWFQNDGNI